MIPCQDLRSLSVCDSSCRRLALLGTTTRSLTLLESFGTNVDTFRSSKSNRLLGYKRKDWVNDLEIPTSKAEFASILAGAYHGKVRASEEVTCRCLHIRYAHPLLFCSGSGRTKVAAVVQER